MLPGSTEIPFICGRLVLRLELRLLIENSSPEDRRFEPARLGDRPGGHLAAVRPTANAQPLRIRFATLQHRTQDRHQVAVITTTPIPAVGLEEFLTVTV